MEVQIRRYSYDLTRPTNYPKVFDDIPTFEEAFDTVSLRKFFQEYDSTNSQSAYSPHRERLTLDEGHSQTAFDNDFLMSPPIQFLSDFQSESENKSSKYNFSFNFNLGPKGLTVKPSSPGCVKQTTMGKPFIITQLIKRSPSEDLEIPLNTRKASEEKVESLIEKRLKNRQVFTIIRESKAKDMSLNVKRKHSAPSCESIDRLVKRVKSLGNGKVSKQKDNTSVSSGFSNF